MNLIKLFETQKKLDARIVEEKGLEGRDLLPEKILALLTELGELSNEWRGFKFWSEDREPRDGRRIKNYLCSTCGPQDDGLCRDCGKETRPNEYMRNPLLEEYVDCLHFILSIGLELEMDNADCWFVENNVRVFQYKDIINQFIFMQGSLAELHQGDYEYDDLFYELLGLGEMLGFTWDQIETAYYEKNKINHERQNTNY